MNTCLDCRYSGGVHSPGCPLDPRVSDEEILLRRAAYSAGWRDGRNRQKADGRLWPGAGASYTLGFLHGDCAADEAENGTPWQP